MICDVLFYILFSAEDGYYASGQTNTSLNAVYNYADLSGDVELYGRRGEIVTLLALSDWTGEAKGGPVSAGRLLACLQGSRSAAVPRSDRRASYPRFLDHQRRLG